MDFVAITKPADSTTGSMYLSAKGHLCKSRRLAIRGENEAAITAELDRRLLDKGHFSIVPVITGDDDVAMALDAINSRYPHDSEAIQSRTMDLVHTVLVQAGYPTLAAAVLL